MKLDGILWRRRYCRSRPPFAVPEQNRLPEDRDQSVRGQQAVPSRPAHATWAGGDNVCDVSTRAGIRPLDRFATHPNG